MTDQDEGESAFDARAIQERRIPADLIDVYLVIRASARARRPAPSNYRLGLAVRHQPAGTARITVARAGRTALDRLIRLGVVKSAQAGHGARVLSVEDGESAASEVIGKRPQGKMTPVFLKGTVSANLKPLEYLPPELPSPIEQALRVLVGRAERVGDQLFLDGQPVAPRDLVIEARRYGARIAYPGVAPHPRARDAGPSMR